MNNLNPVVTLSINNEMDVLLVKNKAREFARMIGFNEIDNTKISIVISELSTNLLKFAAKGEILLEVMSEDRSGLKISAIDQGPGIENVQTALVDGFTTSNTLGSGLPSVKRLMDEFTIHSEMGSGTIINAVIWVK